MNYLTSHLNHESITSSHMLFTDRHRIRIAIIRKSLNVILWTSRIYFSIIFNHIWITWSNMAIMIHTYTHTYTHTLYHIIFTLKSFHLKNIISRNKKSLIQFLHFVDSSNLFSQCRFNMSPRKGKTVYYFGSYS